MSGVDRQAVSHSNQYEDWRLGKAAVRTMVRPHVANLMGGWREKKSIRQATAWMCALPER